MGNDLDKLIASGMSASAATKALATLGGLAGVARATEHELRAAGVPPKTAAKLSVAYEVGRLGVMRAADQRRIVDDENAIDALLRPSIALLAQEVFVVICLDIRNGVIDHVEVARGTVSGVAVHPREVFRPAVRCAAAGIALAHNHPSGDPTPSDDDIALTRKLRSVGDTLGIPVIDHVVIAARGFISIARTMGKDF